MKRFNRILCVVEPEASSEAAIRQAKNIADEHQAELTVASVLTTSGAWGLDFRNKNDARKNLEASSENKRTAIENWVKQFSPRLKFKTEIYSGIEFIEIIRRVIEDRFDLVVKCADDVAWLDRLFASDDMHLLRKCPCPVLMLKPGQNDGFRNILATVDVTDEFDGPEQNRVQEQLNRKVLEYSVAFSLAGLTELHIGSAWQAFAEDFLRYSAFSERSDVEADKYAIQVQQKCANKLNKLIQEIPELVGKDAVDYLRPRVHLVKGQPAREIPLLAKNYAASLVVMGTVARTGIPGFIIGNTAEAILEQIQCSVLAIKPDGFETPVQVN